MKLSSSNTRTLWTPWTTLCLFADSYNFKINFDAESPKLLDFANVVKMASLKSEPSKFMIILIRLGDGRPVC